MDMPIRFDIVEYTKTLAESGVPLDQAEAHALALSRALSEGTPASSELVMVKHELLMRMDVLRQEMTQELDAKLAQLRAELLSKISWFGGLSLAGTLLNTGMLIYLIASHHV